MNSTNLNDTYDTNSADIEEYISNVYNIQIADIQNNTTNSKFSIEDFGDILFAENDRRSKYVCVPFTPRVDSLDKSVDPSFPRRNLSNIMSSTEGLTDDRKPKTIEGCIVNLIRYGWKLPSPQLIISVTGGAHLFKLATPRIRYAFQRGLIAAAVTTDAWIITGGTHAGVMKEVGDAVDKRRYKNTRIPSKVQCIGIGSWYYTTDRQQLFQQRPSPSQLSFDRLHSTSSIQSLRPTSAIVNLNDDQKSLSLNSVMKSIPRTVGGLTVGNYGNTHRERTRIYRSQTPMPNADRCPLDPNHTHFILLDDMLGEDMELASQELTQHINCRADLTIELRAEIEREISDSYSIPIVQILANGGASSILTICKALQQKTPVIVIEGTGRAADKVANEYRYLYGNHGGQRSKQAYDDASSKFDAFDKRIRSPTERHTVLNHTNCEQFIKHLTSPEGYFLISIFQFYNEEGEEKLDDAILHALFNAARLMKNEEDQQITELKLAMAWNKFDRIQRNILTDKTILKWTDLELDRALCDSLRMNKIRFVDLLVEYGARFDRLQRFNLLNQLYREVETSVLPYSKLIIEKIHNSEQSHHWTESDKKYYYEDYLAIDIDNKKISGLSSLNESITNYGILDDDTISKSSTSGFNYPICVFNAIDTIQVNGFLNTVSIRFDNTKSYTPNGLLVCYLISPTNDPNLFHIEYKCSLEPISNNSTNLCHYKTTDARVFVTNGQYIAIGFTHQTGFPCNISRRNQHSLGLDQIESLSPFPSKRSIQFNVKNSHGVAISFNIVSSPEFFRDLFFWSLFFNRYNLATYLCSKSSNTILAALFASKIYHQAASFTDEIEKQLDFMRKEKAFDRHASVILDMCFDENDQFALNILTKPSSLFFNKNPLEIAKEINSRAFLATKTVQRYLDQQWYGHLHGYGQDNFWISSLIFIMCLIPFLIPVQALSRFIISDKRQLKTWEKKPHIIGWSARIFYRFKDFFHERAIVRFYYNIVFYIFFLTLFSFVLLVDYFPLNINGGQRNGYQYILIPITEIFVHILMWSLIFEEGKEFIQHWKEEKSNHSRHIIRNYYMQDKWNILDMIAIVLYLLGFLARWVVIENAFTVSKILMCIDLFLWYIRILHLFAAYERLGPKLLMIFNTMKDLVFFIYFVIIFLAAYSVTSYSLILTKSQVIWKDSQNNPSTREFQVLNNGTDLWNWRILRDVIDWGMWKVYGQVDLYTYHHLNGETEVTLDNDAYGTIAFIFTIFFVSVANVLLLNVLVALFNVTIQKVDNSAHETWAYHRFLLVSEYTKKTFLPPPLNVLIYVFYPFYRFFKNRRPKKLNNTYGIHDDDEISIIDSNLFDMVVFNGVDRIRHVTGFITSVTINFSSPPLISNPHITLYLISSEGNSSNLFHVDGEQILSITHIQQGQKGLQKIPLESPIKCYKDQFIALAFGPHSGSPACVRDRNEHSVNLVHFCSVKDQNKPIIFTNYPNKGAAFSFVIEESVEDQTNQVDVFSIQRKQLANTPIIETRESRNSFPFNYRKSNTPMKSSSLMVTTQTNFEERDNMLRESSIAEDYWKHIIEEIKQLEAKMVEEQNEKINSSVSDSIRDKIDVNNITLQQNDESDLLEHKF